MAIYCFGAPCEVVGYQDLGPYRAVLTLRTDPNTLHTAEVGSTYLRADGGLAEIEAALRAVLGFSPWQPAPAREQSLNGASR